jgi:hypothetical protein
VQPDEAVSCGSQAGLRVGRGASPVGKEAGPPGQKSRPLSGPPFFHHPQVPLACMDRAFFAVDFDPSLCVTAPSRYA